MTNLNAAQDAASYKLLAADEPAAVSVENIQGQARMLITCDHASNRVPKSLAQMNLPPQQLERHIAYDIGALDLSRKLAHKLDAPMIHSGYSRLVVDLNRHLDDPSSMPLISEGTEVIGNHKIGHRQRQARADELFWPYHNRYTELLDDFQSRNIVPLVFAVHTFTPIYHGVKRPWHTGVMWHKDDRLASPFLANLRQNSDLCVGDNQPYSPLDPLSYAFDVHARERGLPHLLVEVRHDLVDTQAGVDRWADILAQALTPILVDESIYTLWSD